MMPCSTLPGGHSATARDGENVLDRHQERLIDLADRLGDERVDRVHQLEDPLLRVRVALEGLEGRHPDDRGVVARELVQGEQLADLELHQLEQLLVVHRVGLVEGYHDRGHADLAGEQDVLTRLGHRPVGGGDDKDRAVDLGGARDHVFDVVGVARHVHVRVVALVGLVLDVGDVDRDPALLLLGGLVDLVEGHELSCASGRAPARTLVIAAVKVVLPWSICPIVPTLRWGLVRSNFCLAIEKYSLCESGPGRRRFSTLAGVRCFGQPSSGSIRPAPSPLFPWRPAQVPPGNY